MKFEKRGLLEPFYGLIAHKMFSKKDPLFQKCHFWTPYRLVRGLFSCVFLIKKKRGQIGHLLGSWSGVGRAGPGRLESLFVQTPKFRKLLTATFGCKNTLNVYFMAAVLIK